MWQQDLHSSKLLFSFRADTDYLHRRPDVESNLKTVARRMWSYHLLASPPNDATLVSLLRKLTPSSNSDLSFVPRTELPRIVQWLKVFGSFGSYLPRPDSHLMISEESKSSHGSCRSLAITAEQQARRIYYRPAVCSSKFYQTGRVMELICPID